MRLNPTGPRATAHIAHSGQCDAQAAVLTGRDLWALCFYRVLDTALLQHAHMANPSSPSSRNRAYPLGEDRSTTQTDPPKMMRECKHRHRREHRGAEGCGGTGPLGSGSVSSSSRRKEGQERSMLIGSNTEVQRPESNVSLKLQTVWCSETL